jgi:transcriptional regulator with XRE-family HTH domain
MIMVSRKKIGTRIPPEFRQKVSKNLKMVIRKEIRLSGWSDNAFFEEHAEQIGVSKQAMYLWYTDWTLPTIYNLYRVAVYFEVSLDYLFGRTNVMSMTEVSAALGKKRQVV